MYTVPKLEDWSASSLDGAVAELNSALQSESSAIRSEAEWKEFRDRWMARKNGILTQINDLWLKAAPNDAKREVGRRVNELKKLVEERVAAAETQLKQSAAASQFESERIDVTLPGIRRPIGVEHPLIKTMNEIVGVFKAMGYSVADGPEVETDYYNFESLNFPRQITRRATRKIP